MRKNLCNIIILLFTSFTIHKSSPVQLIVFRRCITLLDDWWSPVHSMIKVWKHDFTSKGQSTTNKHWSMSLKQTFKQKLFFPQFQATAGLEFGWGMWEALRQSRGESRGKSYDQNKVIITHLPRHDAWRRQHQAVGMFVCNLPLWRRFVSQPATHKGLKTLKKKNSINGLKWPIWIPDLSQFQNLWMDSKIAFLPFTNQWSACRKPPRWNIWLYKYG